VSPFPTRRAKKYKIHENTKEQAEKMPYWQEKSACGAIGFFQDINAFRREFRAFFQKLSRRRRLNISYRIADTPNRMYYGKMRSGSCCKLNRDQYSETQPARPHRRQSFCIDR